MTATGSVDRFTRILAALGSAGDSDPLTAQLCGAAANLVCVSGAAVVVMSGHERPETVCASGDLAASLAEMEFALGEGPALEAHSSGRPVLEPELAAGQRWPAFSEGALAEGAQAVFAFPLQLGAIRLGALALCQTEPGALDTDRLTDAVGMARIATQVVLSVQSQAPAGTLHPWLAAASPHRIVVHQATGMVAAQLKVPMGEAFVRLQAHAYAQGRLLGDVADDVVERRLRFDDHE
jgi:hypothetical protein